MNNKQFEQMKYKKGFIAALDQSGGSTPKALLAYGIDKDRYQDEAQMFELVHEMRKRIIKSPAFSSDKILGAILFERTMDSDIDAVATARYLWEKKGIVPFLKIDQGLAELKDGVQLMKPIPNLENLLYKAIENGIFGTKMRSVIKEYNEAGIKDIVKQQFAFAQPIIDKGLVPIIEPEVDIHALDKVKIEALLKEEILQELNRLKPNQYVMLKLTIPTVDNLYKELIAHPQVVRVVALSGGYTRNDANVLLKQNDGLIASFSRALVEEIRDDQSDQDFNDTLKRAVDEIYDASN